MRDKKDVKLIIILILVLGVLYLIVSVFGTRIEDSVWASIEGMGLREWFLSIIFWIIGLFAWVVTYIGAPIASRKSGKHISGIPGIAFIAFLIAGLLSPCKWLMLIALADFEIILLPIHWLGKKKN